MLSAGLALPALAEDALRASRMQEASALLASREDWPRAVMLYREILADDPDADEARLWLARVLAWRGDYEASLREYDQLRERPGAPADLEVERAEVLSWAGRYEEAAAAFDQALERAPESARAARGLARVYLWSEQPERADVAFERALALEEDPEARRDLERLRGRLARSVSGHADYFSDSDGFSRLRAGVRAGLDLDYATRIVAGFQGLRVALERDDPPGPGLLRRAEERGFEGWLGIERQLRQGLQAALELGGRGWAGAPDRVVARARLDARTPWGGSARLGLGHGDFLERSTSLEAVRAGIRETHLRVSGWQALGQRLGAWAFAESSWLDDGNERVAAGGGLDWSPWLEREWTLSLQGSYLGYTGGSALYYDPDVDVTGLLGIRASQPLVGAFSAEVGSEVGIGYARQDGVGGLGPSWSVSGGPSWKPGDGWWLSLRGSVGRSQRASAYAWHGASLSAGRSF